MTATQIEQEAPQETKETPNLFITPAYPQPIQSATFKEVAEDFIVEEDLGFELTGKGEHLCVQIRKTNRTTMQVMSVLAKWAGIPKKDISYCGLKDKHAVTTQWFSLRIPKQVMPTDEFSMQDVEILQTNWHNKKLGRGYHKANKFVIRLKNVVADNVQTEELLQLISKEGVPNYFTAQRFGSKGNNIEKAHYMFSQNKRFKREERSILLSTARSYIFNQILSERVTAQTWNKAIAGDVFNLSGTNSVFNDTLSDDIHARIAQKDIHPTGCLWGDGELKSTDDMANLEQAVADTEQNQVFVAGLIKDRVKQARRPLRLIPTNMSWQFENSSETSADNQQDLVLIFALPTGSYATAVIAGLVNGFTG